MRTDKLICNTRAYVHESTVDWNPLCAPTGNQILLPGQKIKRESEESGGSGSLIDYKGAMVDVGSMMQKLEKSEKTREEIEQKLMQQDTKMGNNLTCLVFIACLKKCVWLLWRGVDLGHWAFSQYQNSSCAFTIHQQSSTIRTFFLLPTNGYFNRVFFF